MSAPPALFDCALRRVRRDRASRRNSSEFETLVAGELVERLDGVRHQFRTALVINTGRGTLAAHLRARGIDVCETDHGPAFAAASGAILCDEDRLPGELGLFDLVVAPTGLDTINDLPGALIAARRALNSRGMFLGCMIGAPSLLGLRRAASQADDASGFAVARLHPQVDIRAAGDLLVRAGFILPVADSITLDLSYRHLARLLGDLRSFGGSNAMVDRHPATREWYRRLKDAFGAAQDENSQIVETVTLVAMTGWSTDS